MHMQISLSVCSAEEKTTKSMYTKFATNISTRAIDALRLWRAMIGEKLVRTQAEYPYFFFSILFNHHR